MPSPLPRRFRAPWTIFWVAFGLRVACIVVGHTYRIRVPMDHFGFGWEMGRIGRSLALGQGYANPFNGPSGPTAWTPPLYPLLIALSFKLFGIYTRSAAFFLLVINSLFSAAICPAVYEIAARCFDAYGLARRRSTHAEPVALWAAWLWAAYPAALQYAIHWVWEMSLSACLFTWAIVLALRLRRVGETSQVRTFFDSDLAYAPGAEQQPRPAGRGTWAAFGLLWGLIALSNASLLLCLPATLLWIAWPQRRSLANLAEPLKGTALVCVVFAVVMAPWVLRNWYTLHAFVPTRANLGVELYRSTQEEYGALPWGTAMPLWDGDPEFRLYVQMGEVEFARLRGTQAKQRIKAHPGYFFWATGNRILYFWDGTPHAPEPHPAQEYLRQLSYAFLSVCGLLGLGLALKRRVPGIGVVALPFLLVPLVYYVVTVQPRFRHPLEPLIAVLGVYLFRSTEPR